MAGRIRDESIAEVREKARIDDVVGQYVTLRNAGGGSQKGLCPFHDEKTPSFNVNLRRGTCHCFGCEVGGDVFSFLQKIDGLTFIESVERMAEKYGIELKREEGGGFDDRPRGPARGKLIEANRVAQEYYAEQLLTPAAQAGRQFLQERNFTGEDAERFGMGFAPRGGEDLLKHLRQRGFTEEECIAAGLVAQSQRRRLGLRPLPRPAALADPRDLRRDHRLRRPADLRGRPDRREVPQHPRDHALQEEQGALRHRPGPQADGPHLAGRARRGLHRRDGLPPRGRRHRGRVVRHRVRRRPRQDPAPAHGRPRGVPRRGDLHLRRRRGRSGRGHQGVRRRPELRVPDVRRRRARRARPVRPPAQARRLRRSAS